MSEKPTKPADTQQPLFTGPYGKNNEYSEFKPVELTEPKEVNGVSVDILTRGWRLVEALDRLAIVSRNRSFYERSLEEPHRTRMLEHYKTEDALSNSTNRTASNAADRIVEAKHHFLQGTGLLPLLHAGLITESQFNEQSEALWQEFLDKHINLDNSEIARKNREALIKQQIKHHKLHGQEVRRTTRKPKPNSDIR